MTGQFPPAADPATRTQSESKAAAKRQLMQMVDQALDSGRWFVCGFFVKDGLVNYFRKTNDFPYADLTQTEKLFTEDVQKMLAEFADEARDVT